jgi:predicted ATP-grasp superfamily ATP-dependent carboligase
MKVLVTSARFPHALGEIRNLGRQGHPVYAADTFRTAPGLHSRFVTEALLTPRPTYEPVAYVDRIEEIVRTRGIELLAPACEVVFFLARHRERFAALTEAFFPPLETLRRLHNKSTFVELARSLGLQTPRSITVTSPQALREAIGQFPEYLARGAYSRGGMTLLTNTGPLAGRIRVDDCHPTPTHPWLVQEFIRGREVCSFSVGRHGRLVAHGAYVHPKTIEHAGGISYVSVEEPETLAIARTLIEAVDYHGRISLDFVQNARGWFLLECNPRPTAGVVLMPAADLERALCAPVPAVPTVVPAGIEAQVRVALVRDMLHDWRAIPSDLRALLSRVQDTYAQRGDWLPGLFQFLSYTQVLAYRHAHRLRRRSRTDLVEAQFFDIRWDGEPIP